MAAARPRSLFVYDLMAPPRSDHATIALDRHALDRTMCGSMLLLLAADELLVTAHKFTWQALEARQILQGCERLFIGYTASTSKPLDVGPRRFRRS